MRAFYLSILLIGLVFAAGCGSSVTTSSSTTTTSTGSATGANVLAIAVNGGPEMNVANGYIYQNAAFAAATICAPGSTSNCVTIDNLLVDTGSTGLRVFDSEVSSLNLPTVNASNGSAAYDCASFADGTYLWGTVQQADVTLGGETASKVPVHVISSSASGVPSSCSNGGENDNTALLLGANGILVSALSQPIVSMPAAAPAIRRLGSPARPILLITPAAAAHVVLPSSPKQIRLRIP